MSRDQKQRQYWVALVILVLSIVVIINLLEAVFGIDIGWW